MKNSRSFMGTRCRWVVFVLIAFLFVGLPILSWISQIGSSFSRPRTSLLGVPREITVAIGPGYVSDAAVVQLLERYPELITQQSVLGYSALHLAVQYRRYSLIEKLVALGAELEVRGIQVGATSLHYAVQWKDAKAVEILLRLGADPGLRLEKTEEDVYEHAARIGDAGVLRVLKEYADGN